MINEVIRAEITGIAQIAERVASGEVPLGIGEMPCAINLNIGVLACRKALSEDELDRLKVLSYVSFLMGRQFGKLEAAQPLWVIAEAVPMVHTNWPSGLYDMHPCTYIGGDDDE